MRPGWVLRRGSLFVALLALTAGCATAQTPGATPTTDGPGLAVNRIRGLDLTEEPDRARIVIKAAEPFTYTAYRLEAPLRLVVDIFNADLGPVRGEPIPVEDGTIQSITPVQLRERAGLVSRFEIGLRHRVPYEVRAEGPQLNILIDKVSGSPAAADVPSGAAPPGPPTGPPQATGEDRIQKGGRAGTESPAPAEPIQGRSAEPSTPPVAAATPPATPAPAAPPPAAPQPGSAPRGEAVRVVAASHVTVRVEPRGPYTLVTILGDGQLGPYTVFTLRAPARLVLDLPRVRAQGPKQMRVDDGRIQAIRVGHHPDRLRVVFDGAREQLPPYAIERDGSILRILLGLDAFPAPARPSAPAPVAPAAPPGTRTGAALSPAQAPNPAIPTPGGAPQARAGQAVAGTEPPKGAGAVAPTPVRIAQAPEIPSAAAASASAVIQRGDSEANGSGRGRERPAQAPQAAGVVLSQASPGAQPAEGGRPTAEPEPVQGPRGKVYTGQRMSLDLKDADIHNVLRLIAEVSELNIIAGEDVRGKVTLRLIDVPWDQALDILLTASNLGMDRVGNVVRIAPFLRLKQEEKARADAEREARKAQKDLEKEQEDLVTRILEVNYGKAKEFAEQLTKLKSDRKDANITVDDRTNTLVLQDAKSSVEKMVEHVKNLDKPTPQVQIEARIVEADTQFARELGIQWGGRKRFPGPAGGTGDRISGGTVVGGNLGAVGEVPDPNFAVDLPAAVGRGAGGAISFGFITANLVLDARLSALESRGLGRVISSPKITTLHNKEALIKQGQTIPFQTVSQAGTQTTFFDATLNLTVKPQVTPDGSINMEVRATNDEPGDPTPAGPTIRKKEAKTEVLVKDGETLVIGGILKTSERETIAGVPGLMNIPILGWLFKKTTKRTDQSELLIFITPRIVQTPTT
ncbi:MAG: type IV pilus secretin PilQ [Deltaproteobacteria bacterium]|nr:type IV pilus secretin PilQ [Deltaproteobacteria bacterium]